MATQTADDTNMEKNIPVNTENVVESKTNEDSEIIDTIIRKDEEGEIIDMDDIKVLEDLKDENKSPEKDLQSQNSVDKEEETTRLTQNSVVRVEGKNNKRSTEEQEEPPVKKRKPFEFFNPDMVSTLELALLGLPSMANCQGQKKRPPKEAEQIHSDQTKKEEVSRENAIRRSTRNRAATQHYFSPPVQPRVAKQQKDSPVKTRKPQIRVEQPVLKKDNKVEEPANKKTKVVLEPKTMVQQKVVPRAVVQQAVTKPKDAMTQLKQDGGQQVIVMYPTTHSGQVPTMKPPLIRNTMPRSREWRKKSLGSRPKSKGGLIVDRQKEIPTMMMKMRVSDTSDIVTSLDLAPPTKKLMQLKEAEGRETVNLLSSPGRTIVPKLANRLYYANLVTKQVDSDEEEDGFIEDVEEEDPDREKKCFTIIRSEPVMAAEDEDQHIHYTNQLSDTDDDEVPGPADTEEQQMEPTTQIMEDEEVVSEEQVITTEVVVEDFPVPISEISEVSKSSDVTGQTVANTSQGDTENVVSVTNSLEPMIKEEITPTNSTADVVETVPEQSNLPLETLPVRESLNFSEATVTSTAADVLSSDNTVQIEQCDTESQVVKSETQEEHCIVVSVVTELSEPIVQQDGEVVNATSADVVVNSSETIPVSETS